MSMQFVQGEAPDHGLFALDKLQLRSQFLHDEALGQELFKG